MASSSLTVYCDRGEIRKYGGTRGDVKYMHQFYQRMTWPEFLGKHPHLTEEDYGSLQLYVKFNKS